jgi:hypothetical protein
MKTPTYPDAEKCIELRKKSKQGIPISKEDHAFCRQMFKNFETWYSKTEKRVFNETVPFGSNVWK